MNDVKQRLCSRFRNGSLPDEDDFADLIDSFVTEQEFDKHIEEFVAFRNSPSLTVGDARREWRIQGKDGDLSIYPAKAAAPVVASDIRLSGWVGGSGRIGDVTDAGAFESATFELSNRNLPKVASDGGWHAILRAPGRPCAVEIVAATDAPAQGAPTIWGRCLRLLGYRRPANAALRAVAVNAASGGAPGLNVCDGPQTALRRARSLVALALILFGVSISAPDGTPAFTMDSLTRIVAAVATPIECLGGLIGEEATILGEEIGGTQGGENKDVTKTISPCGKIGLTAETKKGASETGVFGKLLTLTPGSAVALFVPWLLFATFILLIRQVVAAFFESRATAAIRWRRTGGSRLFGTAKYELQLKGPMISGPGGQAPLRYHMTKLWG